jgi:hypothetical protein
MTIKLSNKIKMPTNRSSGAPEKYPWAKMKVGDSFACDLPFTAASGATKRYAPKVFSVRKYGDGHRCWRVK